jgi:uncharacterized protein YggE
MNKAFLFIPVLVILSVTAAFAQNKKNVNNDEAQEQKDEPNIIRVNGFADSLVDPSFVEMNIVKQYTPGDIDGDPMAALQQEIKDVLNKDGVDSSKYNLSVTYSNPMAGGRKSDVAVSNFLLRVYDISKVSDVAAKLSAKGYSIRQFKGELDNSIVDFEGIDKVLLARAIREGKEKAVATAEELGVKNYSLQNFIERGLKNNSSQAFQGPGATVGKVKMQKSVTLIYKIN